MAQSFIKDGVGKVIGTWYNLRRGIYAFVSGTQLKSDHLKWLRENEKLRDRRFKELGYLSFELLDPNTWRNLSEKIQSYFKDFGTLNESKVGWAINKRVYLDLEKDVEINNIVSDIVNSASFKSKVDAIIGSSNWEMYSIQIWRNYPEDFNNKEKEINSSFYHVDNGGDKENRLLVNIFMYLSPVNELNGPFTYYDKESSRRINKKFFTDIVKYGNLRKYFLTKKVEQFLPPNILLESNGVALAINNQECLHRAGFCSEGHRDIVEFLIKQTN